MRYLKLDFNVYVTWNSTTIIEAEADCACVSINRHSTSLNQRQIQLYIMMPFAAMCYRLYAQWHPNNACISAFTTVGNVITWMMNTGMSPSVNFTQPTDNHYLQRTVTSNTTKTYGWMSSLGAYAQSTQHNFNLGSGADTNGAYTRIHYMPMYRFADDDPNYETLLELYPDKVIPVPEDWVPSDEPEPPGGDKAVYRYHTDTGWVKEGSIYVRESGAWVAGSGSIKVLDGWSPIDWGLSYAIAGFQVWYYDGHVYYNGGIRSLEFNKATKTWFEKTWVGLNFTSSDSGTDIWTDGTNMYYSYSNKQLVLNSNTMEWTTKTWNGYTPYYGRNTWIDNGHVYYSSGTNQYELNKATSTWTPVTWSGLAKPAGNSIWHDGEHTYYSSGSNQYELDRTTSTWLTKTWTGVQPVGATNIWTDGTTIYFSDGPTQFELNKATSTWTAKTWSGLTSFYGMYIWTDGDTYYYAGSSTSDQYYATDHIIPDPTHTMCIHERVNNQWQAKT